MPAPHPHRSLTAALAALAIWMGTRWRRARRMEREADVHPRRSADGVIVGAEAIALEGDGPAVVLLHGFGDTPQSMRGLAESLHARGWTVHVPLLPGHGRTLRAFAATTRAQWYAAALGAYDALRRQTPVVAVVGQSMGGALAVRLAADRQDVRALVLLAPYLSMLPRVSRLARFHWAVSLLTPYLHSRAEGSIRDAAARAQSLGYGYTSPRLLRELQRLTREAWAAAPLVRAPTLMIQSRHDNRIAPAAAEAAFHRLGAGERELVWADESGHVLSVDFGHDATYARTAAWLERHLPAVPGPQARVVTRA